MASSGVGIRPAIEAKVKAPRSTYACAALVLVDSTEQLGAQFYLIMFAASRHIPMQKILFFSACGATPIVRKPK
jgi:hypothetical protein